LTSTDCEPRWIQIRHWKRSGGKHDDCGRISKKGE
jgi:hypothetical protein